MSDIKVEPRASIISVSQSLSSFVEQQISGPSTSYMVLLPVQGGIEQSQFRNVHIRESIKKHIKLSDRLTKAANQVLYKKKDIIDIALSYDLNVWILERKVHILKRTNNYLAFQFQYAMHKLTHYADFHGNLIQSDLLCVAEECDIEIDYIQHLREECRRYHKLDGLINYTYEKITISYGVFTSSQEESLLQRLNKWKDDYSYFKCHCQLCALEYLVSLAYKFANEEKISYPSVWNINKGADELWLLEFEMRNSVEMVRFPPASSCTKESPVSTCAWESSSLFEQQEISEPSTTSRAQGDIGSSQLPNVPKSEERLKIIRGRIKRHVEISDQLDKAAKQVLEENKDIGSVAHNHKLDLWILNKKVHILKFRKTQFDKRRKHDAVNAVKCNILSVSDAAKEYRVDKDFIHDSLKKSKNSDSSVLMTYEELETDDTVLTLNEEFLLLRNLQRQVRVGPDCECRSCALLKLSSLAYKFAKQNKEQYPFAWNIFEEADMIWICEFEMRHSIEISNYFQNQCMADIVSTNSSESLLTFDYQ